MAKPTKDELDRVVAGQTVASRFRDAVAAHPDDVALRWLQDDDSWGELTLARYGDQAARAAAGLADLGVQRGDRVVLMMRNRPEFHVADTAAMLCGATPVSIYNSSAPEQVQYLASHSEATVAILEDVGYLERFLKVRPELPLLRHVVLLDDPDGLAPDDVVPWERFVGDDPVDLDRAAGVAQPDDLATIIYTSGTTGPPKGVMISHYNVVFTAQGYLSLLERPTRGWRGISYLPMAHIAERMTGHYLGIIGGLEVSTCPDTGMLNRFLTEVRPQTFFGVPRVWEKLYAGVNALIAADENLAKQFDDARDASDPVEAFAPLRQLLGLDQLEVAVTGAAAIPVEVFEWFRTIGVPLSEVYGMSESTGPITWDPWEVKAGTVGRAFPGCEVTTLDDGEVVCRGGNVFQGYLKEQEKTAEALDADGWLHSGDIGEIDGDGYLRIVDRKKELIITAGGKNISPANLESALKSFPLIGQACVIGDGRPFISALIVLDPEVAPAWAKQHGIDGRSPAELAANDEVRAEVERSVKEANTRFSQVEQVKKFTILPDEWLPDSDELTPTMKLKRRGVSEKYAAEIDALYAR